MLKILKEIIKTLKDYVFFFLCEMLLIEFLDVLHFKRTHIGA